MNPEIAALKAEMTKWRQHIHSYPETAFKEHKTTQFIIDQLESFGVDELHTDFAPTGVVGIINAKRREDGLRYVQILML